MIKNFGQWIVVKDGIETSVGYGYCWISKDDVMSKNTSYAKTLMQEPSINIKSLQEAFEFAYRYFHAMTTYSAKSHPQIHKKMMSEFKELQWHKSERGNYTTPIFEGFNITVFKNEKDRWAWVYDDIFSKGTYTNVETAKKKAFASYCWLSHIKNGRKKKCKVVEL